MRTYSGTDSQHKRVHCRIGPGAPSSASSAAVAASGRAGSPCAWRAAGRLAAGAGRRAHRRVGRPVDLVTVRAAQLAGVTHARALGGGNARGGLARAAPLQVALVRVLQRLLGLALVPSARRAPARPNPTLP